MKVYILLIDFKYNFKYNFKIMLTDIYMLEKNKYNLHDINSSCDYSNVIFKKEKIDFICSNCTTKTVFLTDAGLCPSCHFEKNSCFKCGDCNRQLGCISCGGKSKCSVQINGLTFCRTNKCLMPFGFYIPYKESICVCSKNIENFTVLCKDLSNTVNSFGKKPLTCWNEYYILPDLSTTKSFNCTHCELDKKYKSVGDIKYYNSKYLTCNCF